ncbi:MAG: bacillithiol system redox-active protein YtxJ [Candidatus Glassbacteria bacterium]|nr:bacillithiol system redox-active protein YtxJ [Candidatus Glassbacteria bacterium]
MYKTIEELAGVLQASRDKPILILKHSRTCPISARAKARVDAFLGRRSDLEAYLVVVQDQRKVSDELAQALGVGHQSPQVLAVRQGKAEKALSHYQITEESLALCFGDS